MENLFEIWLNRMDSFYEEQYYEPVVEALCQYHGGSADGRVAKGKLFSAGYEVFIYAFYVGLYYGERTPLKGEKRKFRMEMSTWGRKKNEQGRKSYTILQKYIFTALVAKSDIDLIALDKGENSSKEICDALMITLNEYANTGFGIIKSEMSRNNGKFMENTGLVDFIKNFC